MSDIKYTITGLSDIVNVFRTYANDQIATKRFHTTQKGKRENDIRADIWNEAADMISKTTIIPFPTEEAYMSACRALHWRTAELKAYGIEPTQIPLNAPAYPPDDAFKVDRLVYADNALAIAEEAFRAGYAAANDGIGGETVFADRAWSNYELSEAIKDLTK